MNIQTGWRILYGSLFMSGNLLYCCMVETLLYSFYIIMEKMEEPDGCCILLWKMEFWINLNPIEMYL